MEDTKEELLRELTLYVSYLDNGFMVTEAFDTTEPETVQTIPNQYFEAAKKIRQIERKYTPGEIVEMNLLVDIW